MKKAISLAILFFVIGLTYAQNITLEEFLSHIEKSYPMSDRLELGIRYLEEEKVSLTGSKDLQYGADATLAHIPQTSSQSGLKNTTALSVGANASKLNWNNGAILSADVSMGGAYLSIDNSPMYSSMANSSFDNSLYVTYILPLKKNSSGILYKMPYDMKDVEIAQEQISNMESIENFLSSFTQDFVEWSYLKIEREILNDRMELATQSFERNKKKRQSNLIDEVDVVTAENSIKNIELSISANKMSEKALIQKLNQYTPDISLDDKNPEYDIYHTYDLPNIDALISEFKEQSRTLAGFSKSIELMNLNMEILKEQLKPDVSLTARAGLTDSDDKYLDALLMDKPEVSLTLSYDFPSDKTTEKANISMLEISMDQLNIQYDETVIEFESTIRNIYSQLEDIKNLLEINSTQIELAKKQTKEYTALYERGKSDFAFVLQSQDAEEAALLAYAKNSSSYHKLYWQLQSIFDKLYTK